MFNKSNVIFQRNCVVLKFMHHIKNHFEKFALAMELI